MTLKLAPSMVETPIPLTREQILILETLERHGPTKACMFDAFEDHLDDLFRMRPRFIMLVPGHVDAIVSITGAGRQGLRHALS